MLVKIYNYNDVPTIREFSQSDAFIRGLMGPFGSGKSSGCVIEIGARSQDQKAYQGRRRSRWAVIRNTYRQLQDTTIKTFHEWFPPEHCGVWKATDHNYQMYSSHTDGTKVECEVLFRALDRPDQVSNLLSLELTGAWINEAREVPKAIIDALTGRVNRFPPQREGGATSPGIIMDTNPPDTDHWWYRMFEELQFPDFDYTCRCGHKFNMKGSSGICPVCGLKYYDLFKQPSGRSPKAENLQNLPPNYYQNLTVGKDAEFMKVYVDGTYGYVQDGKPVYANYLDSSHVAKMPLQPIPAIPLTLGWDFGLTPACVITQFTPRGQLNIIDEFYTESVGIRQFARSIVKPALITKYAKYRCPIISVGDPGGRQRAQTDEKTCLMELDDAGIRTNPGRTNNITARVNAVDYFLTRIVDGKPAFQLSPNCKILRKGFNSGYRYKRMQVVGDEKYHDVPDKNMYSHLHDALQYAAMESDMIIVTYEREMKNRIQQQREQPYANMGAAWT